MFANGQARRTIAVCEIGRPDASLTLTKMLDPAVVCTTLKEDAPRLGSMIEVGLLPSPCCPFADSPQKTPSARTTAIRPTTFTDKQLPRIARSCDPYDFYKTGNRC